MRGPLHGSAFLLGSLLVVSAGVAADTPDSSSIDLALTRPHESLSCEACHTDAVPSPDGEVPRVLPPSDPESAVHRDRVAETCGGCHAPALEAFEESIHGSRLVDGSAFVPPCTNCHDVNVLLAEGRHLAPTRPGKVVFTCAECHEDPAVTRGTDLDGAVVESYERTFHGVAYGHGATDVATCVSCHGAHDVLPSRDPAAPTLEHVH